MFNSVQALKKCNVRVIVDMISMARVAAKSKSPGDLSELVKLANQLTIKHDFNGFYTCVKCGLGKKPPNCVSYTKILETPLLSMGLFHVHPGLAIPLHDHPNMTGIIKVLKGDLKIFTFDKSDEKLLDDSYINAELVSVRQMTKKDPCALVEPNKNNIHHIRSVSDECACFFDILFPAYTKGNEITYYGIQDNYNKLSDYDKLDSLAVNSVSRLLKLRSHPAFFQTDIY